ncbi:MAG: serine/threonine-protein kinase, partial [Planctomycetota bacterium]
ARAGEPDQDELEVPGAGSLARAADLRKRRPRVRLIARLARALATCHAENIYHRDIKPGNVLLPSADRPTLIDFGLAHLAQPGADSAATISLMGTPAYLAPEQVDQSRTGAQPASDQFSLAVVLYELLTLQHPFAKASREDTLRSISMASPKPLRAVDRTIPHELDWICMKALSRTHVDRYSTVAEFADDLDAFLEGMAVSARRTPLFTRVKRTLLQRRLPIAAGLLGAGLAVAGVLGARELEARKGLDAVLAEARELREELPDLDSAGDFERALARQRVLRVNAARSTDRLLGRLERDRLEEAVSGVERTLGLELDRRLLELAVGESLPIARRLRMKALESRAAAWSEVAQLALADGVDSLLNGAGARWLPAPGDEVLEISRVLEARESDRGSERVPHERGVTLAPGRYRVRARRSGRAIEVDLEVLERQWRAELPVALCDCAPALEWVELDGSSSLWMTSAPIDQKQFDSCFGPGELAYLDASRRGANIEASSPDGPVRTSGAYALEFALRLGCRLPTAAELVQAARSGCLAVEPRDDEIVLVSDRIAGLDQSASVSWQNAVAFVGDSKIDQLMRGFDAVAPRGVLFLVRRESDE